MADQTSPIVEAEPVQADSHNIEKADCKPETATTEKTGDVKPASAEPDKVEAAAAQDNSNGANHGQQSGRSPPRFDPTTEDHIRELMHKAKAVAKGSKDNSFKSEDEIKELAEFTTNLVQLMNAAYIVSSVMLNPRILLTHYFSGYRYDRSWCRIHAR